MIRFIVGCIFFLSSLFATTISQIETLKKGERVVAKGVVIYSKPLELLVDKDNKKEHKVVMAAKLFVKKTKDGYKGYMVRGLYDINEKKPLLYYASKLILHPPTNLEILMQDIQIKDNKLTFTLPPYHYTVIDGGKGYLQDEVEVRFAKRKKTLKLYGGDIELFSKSK